MNKFQKWIIYVLACAVGIVLPFLIFSFMGGRYYFPTPLDSPRFDRLTGTVRYSDEVETDRYVTEVIDPFQIDGRVREGDYILWESDLSDPVTVLLNDRIELVIRDRDEFYRNGLGEICVGKDPSIVFHANHTYVFLPAKPQEVRRYQTRIAYRYRRVR